MKAYKYLVIILILGACFSCEKIKETSSGSSEISDGIYIGRFSYQNTDYWSSITFHEGQFEEWPSGGMYYQKGLTCLTNGLYLVNDKKLSFNSESFKYPEYPDTCNADMLLPGDYEIIYQENDSLVFERGSGDSKIIYFLYLEDFRELNLR